MKQHPGNWRGGLTASAAPPLLSMAMIHTILFVALLLIATCAHAKGKPWHYWPCSKCTGGWVDAMTGMCPYRPYCKIAGKKSKTRRMDQP